MTQGDSDHERKEIRKMKKLSHEEFQMYLEVESAVAPLDDVIAVLCHAYEDFNLGNRHLDKLEQIDLLNRYETLGSLIMMSVNELRRVVEDVQKIGEDRKKDSEDQEQKIG